MNIKIPEKQNKTKIVSLRMTEEQHNEFNNVAESLRCSVATLILEIAKARIACELVEDAVRAEALAEQQ